MSAGNRPLSPHLQVYRLPMLALLSITHRITGFGLSVGAVLIPLVLIALSMGPEAWASVQTPLLAWYGQAVLFWVSLSLVFHFLNGIRHLVWDTGRNLAVPNAERSGIAVIVLTVIITAGVWGWVYGCFQSGGAT